MKLWAGEVPSRSARPIAQAGIGVASSVRASRLVKKVWEPLGVEAIQAAGRLAPLGSSVERCEAET